MDTHAVLIVDKSGSMHSLQEDVIGGFNSYLDGLEENIYVSCMLFDTDFNILFRDRSPKLAKRLSKKNYRPGGNTALYDAIGKTLHELEFPEEDAVMVVIQTDGLENSSREYTSEQVKSLVFQREEQGWNFIYLGASDDAWSASRAIGIGRFNTFYTKMVDPEHIKLMYSGVTATTNSWNDYVISASTSFGMDADGMYLAKKEAGKVAANTYASATAPITTIWSDK